MRPVHAILLACVVALTPIANLAAQPTRAFSFQGLLTDDLGEPIDGFVDIDVSIWDSSSAGSGLWSDSFTNHPVVNGVFQLTLEGSSISDTGVFEGDTWLEIEVEGEAIGPRTRIVGAPFALGLALPIWQNSFLAYTAFSIQNEYGPAINGESEAIEEAGVSGTNGSITGVGYGVAGLGESPQGVGVLGRAEHETGVNHGVKGFTASPNGYGGHFDGGNGLFARGASNLGPDLILGGSSADDDDGRIFSDPAYDGSDIWIHSNDDVVFYLDSDSTGVDASFQIRYYGSVQTDDVIFEVDESGDVIVQGSTVHSSDRNRKQNIVPVDTRRVLEDVIAMPISTWQYKNQDILHMGPMAQDFYAAFDVGNDERHIAAVDADGVALAAIQGLYELVAAQQAEIERMRRAMIDAGLAIEP